MALWWCRLCGQRHGGRLELGAAVAGQGVDNLEELRVLEARDEKRPTVGTSRVTLPQHDCGRAATSGQEHANAGCPATRTLFRLWSSGLPDSHVPVISAQGRRLMATNNRTAMYV